MKKIRSGAQSHFQNASARAVLFLVCLFAPIGATAQIDPDTGTGTVGGYFIGPGITRSNINLSNADLRGANLSGANLTDVDLSGADLRDANLTDAIFTRVDLRNANLAGANVANAELRQLQLAGAQVGPLNGTPKFIGILSGFDVQVGPDVNGKRWIFAPDVRMHGIRVQFGAAFGVWEQNIFFAGIARTDFLNAEWIGDMNPPRSLNTLNLTGLKTSHATITFREGPAPNFTPIIVNPPEGWFYVDQTTRVDTLSANWRNLLLGPNVNFSGGNLSNVSITGKNLSGANLENSNLSGATLRNTNLTDAKLANADAQGLSAYGSPGAPASLPTGWRFVGGAMIGPGARFPGGAGVDLAGQDLSGLDLTGADLRGALLAGATSGGISGTPSHLPNGWQMRNGYLIGPRAQLAGADLRDTNLDGIELDGLHLEGAQLEGASLIGARITGVTGTPSSLPTGAGIAAGVLLGPGCNASGLDLSGSNMAGLVLTGANFQGANLNGATLIGAQFNGANLADSDLDNANLTNANLLLADLSRSRIVGADITGAQLFAATLEGLRSRHTVGPPASLPLGNWGFVSGYVLGPKVNLSAEESTPGFLNLNSVSLDGINLRGSDLRGCILIQVSLDGADFSDADLSGGSLLANSDCRPALWERANLSGATFLNSSFPALSDLSGARLSPLYISAGMHPLDFPSGTTAYVTDEYDALFFGPMKELQIVGPGLDVSGANLAQVDLASSNHGKVIGTPSTLPARWQLTGGYFLGPNARLAGADLAGLDLNAADLTGADLRGTHLDGTRFASASGSATTLAGVRSGNITGTPLNLPAGWSLRGGYLIGLEADLTDANFTGVNLADVVFAGSDLSRARFSSAILNGADMDGSIIEGAEFAGADLAGLRAKNLTGTPASLPSSWLVQNGYLLGPGVDLSGRLFDETQPWPVNPGNPGEELRDLSHANLRGTRILNQLIYSTDFQGADLRDTDFSGSIFRGCDLSGTLVEGMKTSRIAFFTAFPFTGLPDDWAFFLESRSTSFFHLDLGYLIGPGADISGANFAELNLSGVRAGPMMGSAASLPQSWKQIGAFLFGPEAIFGDSDLTGLNLANTNLDGAEMEYATLTRVRSGAITGKPNLPAGYQIIDGWLLGPDVDLTAADFSEIHLQAVDLSAADLTAVRSGGTTGSPSLPTGYRIVGGFLLGPNVDLSGATLEGLDLTGCDLTGADFSNLRSSGLRGNPTLSPGHGLASGHLVGPGVDLSFAAIHDADLTGLDFTGSTALGLRSSGLSGTPTLPAGFILAEGHLIAPGVDLSGVSLNHADLSGADLTGANLNGTDLRGVSLQDVRSGSTAGNPLLSWGTGMIDGILFGPGVDLSGVNLTQLNLTGIDLRGANFFNVRSSGLSGFPILSDDFQLVGGHLIGPDVDLSDTDLGALDLRGTVLTGVRSGGTTGNPLLPAAYRLEGGYLIGPGVNLTDADLQNLDLSGLSLRGAQLAGADLRGALLEGVSSGGISGTPLLPSGFRFVGGYILGPGVDLTGLILRDTSLRDINLSGANLSGAELRNLDLISANLEGANLSGATLQEIKLAGAVLTSTLLDRVDSSQLSSSGSTTLPSGYRVVNGSLTGPAIAGRVARYVRFEGYGSSNNGSIDLTEIQVFNDLGENLAPGSTLSCDVPHLRLQNLADGRTDPLFYFDHLSNFSTQIAPPATNEAPHRVDLDFGAASWVSEIVLHPFAFSLTYRLFTSLDGENWEPVAPARTDIYVRGEVIPYSTIPNPDFSGADLSGADLRGTNLQGVRSGNTSGQPLLPGSFMHIGGYLIGPGANLDGANLDGLDLRNAHLQGVRAAGVAGSPVLPPGYSVRNGFLLGPGVDLDGLDLSELNLGSANLTGASLVGSNLRGTDLRGTTLTDANLSGAVLVGAKLEDAIAYGTRFNGALFTFATFGTGAMYDETTDFSGALLIAGSEFSPEIPLVPEEPNWRLNPDRGGNPGGQNPAPDFRAWAQANGLSDAFRENDPSPSGHPLLLHHALDLPPHAKIPESRIPRIKKDSQHGFPLFYYAIPKRDRGVTFVPEISQDLAGSWQSVAGFAVRIGEDDLDRHYVISIPYTSAVFFRMRME